MLLLLALLIHFSRKSSISLNVSNNISVDSVVITPKKIVPKFTIIKDPDSLKKIIPLNKFSSEIFLQKKFKTRNKDFKNAILVDLDSNKILYQKNAYKMVEIASVTKLMSILLILEALEDHEISLTDTLIASRKSSLIGGSQIYLKEKEKIIIDDLLKSIVIKSANDATYLMAETLGKYNSVRNFVAEMNRKSREIGMKKSIFYYPHGLPPTWEERKKKHIPGNLSTCYDLAILTKQLLKHPIILEYSSIWLDSIRTSKGQKPFQLRNTSRLIKDYKYFDGLKTGFYSRAGFCIVATALKNKRRLVAVILGSRNQKNRNKLANELVTWGYSQIEQTDSLKNNFIKKTKKEEEIAKNKKMKN